MPAAYLPRTRRAHRLLILLVIAGCATSSGAPMVDAGMGSGGDIGVGGFTAASSSGVGGFGLGGAGGTSSDVDASACSAFAETFMPACVACLDDSCCDVAAMCFAVPDCFGYTSCQQNCPAADAGVGGVSNLGGAAGAGGGNSCLEFCAMNYPMAGAPFAALTACLHTNCSACPY